MCVFANGENGVVPDNWIFRENGKIRCRWTSALKSVKEAKEPNPVWRVFDITKIHGSRKGNKNNALFY